MRTLSTSCSESGTGYSMAKRISRHAPGPQKALQAIDRDSVIEFHRDFWRPEKMILAVSGDITTSAVLELLESRLASWPSGNVPRRRPHGPRNLRRRVSLPVFITMSSTPHSPKSSWDTGCQTCSTGRDNERFVLALVAEILGGKGAVSRIGGRLRTAEGLVYRVGLDIDPGNFWPGKFEIFL